LTVTLQFPAASSQLLSHSSPGPTQGDSNPGKNVGFRFSTQVLLTFLQSRPITAPPIPISSASNTMTSRLRHLLSSWPFHTGHSLPPVVTVPLAHGKEVCPVEPNLVIECSHFNFQRNAAAGAPKCDRGYRRDEEFDSPPSSPSSDSRRAAQEVTGEHGRGRLCFCL